LKRVDTIARVRRAFHVQGWSMKKIVRELHVSRNTVRKILRTDETDFSYERERQPMPRIGPWQGSWSSSCRPMRQAVAGTADADPDLRGTARAGLRGRL
jgi:orotate phosphoribosyltransferase-like protein